MNELSRKMLGVGRLLQSCRQVCNSHKSYSAYEGPGRTTLNILNTAAGGLITILAANPSGFILSNKCFVVGPMALFPKTILHWKVTDSADINEASLSLFINMEPKLDILIIGMHRTFDNESVIRIRKIMKKHGIALELLPVHRACEAYNFILDEGRHTAAALMPPWEPGNLPIETTKLRRSADVEATRKEGKEDKAT